MPTAAPRRDDTGPDHGSAPFVAQLIASRTSADRTQLQLRLLADRSAAAYRTAEALPYALPTGIYLRHSL